MNASSTGPCSACTLRRPEGDERAAVHEPFQRSDDGRIVGRFNSDANPFEVDNQRAVTVRGTFLQNRDYLDFYYRTYPTEGTWAGYHTYDSSIFDFVACPMPGDLR